MARKGAAQYAFYRGTTHVGAPPAPTAAAQARTRPSPRHGQKPPSRRPSTQNLKILNNSNQMRQIERLQNRYKAEPPSGKGGGRGRRASSDPTDPLGDRPVP